MLTYVNLCLPLLTYVNRSKDIRGIRMQNLTIRIWTIRKAIKTFETKFEPIDRDSKRWNPNSNHSKGIQTIPMQKSNYSNGIRSIRKGLETFERDSKGIRNIRKGFEAFECKFKPFEGIRGIRMHIWSLLKGLEAFECIFKPFERYSKHSNANSNHSNKIQSIQMKIRILRTRFEAFVCKFLPFERDSKLSKPNSKHSKGVRSIQKQIRMILSMQMLLHAFAWCHLST